MQDGGREKLIGNIMGIAALVFAVLMFISLTMPHEWHYECIGTVIKHEEGQFYSYNSSVLTPLVIYEHKVYYRADDGSLRLRYFDDTTTMARDIALDECIAKGWTHVYRYRWWTWSVIYIVMTFIFFVLYSKLTFDENEIDYDE